MRITQRVINEPLIKAGVLAAVAMVEGLRSSSFAGEYRYPNFFLRTPVVTTVLNEWIKYQIRKQSGFSINYGKHDELIDDDGTVIRLHVGSGETILSNNIKDQTGFFIFVFYSLGQSGIKLGTGRYGELSDADWKKASRDNSNASTVEREILSKLQSISF